MLHGHSDDESDATAGQPDFEHATVSHLDYYSSLVREFGPLLKGAGVADAGRGQLTALRALGVEIENIYAALDAAIGGRRTDLLLQFAEHLWQLLGMRGEALFALKVYSHLQNAAQESGSERLELWAMLGLARAANRMGEGERVAELVRKALPLARRFGVRAAEAVALNCAGLAAELGNVPAEARTHFATALAIWEELGSSYGAAACLNNLGTVEARAGNRQLEQDYYSRALHTSRAAGDFYGVAAYLNNLSAFELEGGDYPVAREMYLQALELRRKLGDRYGEAITLNGLGGVERELGRSAEARALHLQALAIHRELGNRHDEALCLRDLERLGG